MGTRRKISIVVLTGAGVSADSGLATFRGAGGLWEGQRVEDVATPAAWIRDPARVWRFYQLRRARLLEVRPNAAHEALVRLERAASDAGGGFTLVTQNVDGLHQAAGSRVLAMHGDLRHLRCTRCESVLLDLERLDPADFATCAACGHRPLRPDVVWFGEVPRHLDEIGRALGRCTHFVSVGTSGVVYPAAGLLAAARARGAETWVNSLDEPWNLDPADRFLPGRAVDVLPRAVQAWIEEWL